MKTTYMRARGRRPAVSEKVIVHIRAGVDVERALDHVAAVVRMGRVSADKTAFCHATTFRTGMVVYSRRNKASDTFWVQRDPTADLGPAPTADPPNHRGEIR